VPELHELLDVFDENEPELLLESKPLLPNVEVPKLLDPKSVAAAWRARRRRSCSRRFC